MEPPLTETSLLRLVGEGLAVCYRGAAGYEASLTPDATLVLSGEAAADLNYAVIAASAAPQERFGAFSERIQARQTPLLLTVSPAVNDQLAPLMPRAGLHAAGTAPLMTAQALAALPITSTVTVTCVTSPADLQVANRLIAQAFTLPEEAVQRAFGAAVLDAPGFEQVLAWREDRPVGTMQTTRFGSTVGIWAMAVAPDAQRTGIGRALLAQVMSAHQERGATLFYLVATDAGYGLYTKLGFRTVLDLPVWVAGVSSQVH